MRPKGRITQIDYRADFDTYHSTLLDALREEYPPTVQLFYDWDEKIFETPETVHERPVRPKTADERRKDEQVRARAQMRRKLGMSRRQVVQSGSQEFGQEEQDEMAQDVDAD